ncbi:MAG: hypothetical protein RMZ43_018240 [Nostoc sp. CmiVER01]
MLLTDRNHRPSTRATYQTVATQSYQADLKIPERLEGTADGFSGVARR